MADELPFLFSTVQGSAETRQFRLTDATGTAVSTFTGSESLSAKLYAGDDITSSITPTLAWGTPPVVTLTISAGATTSIAARPGYILAFTIGSTTRLMGRVDILPASASGTLATSDITYDDLRRYAGNWVDSLLTKTDAAGWAEMLGVATRDVWDQCLDRARKIIEDQARRHGPIVEVTAIEPTTGYDDGPSWGPSILPDTTIRDQLDVIEGHLTSGKLIKSDRYKRAVAFRAASLICQAQCGPDKDTPYWSLRDRYQDQYIRTLAGLTFEIDTDTDGVADFTI